MGSWLLNAEPDEAGTTFAHYQFGSVRRRQLPEAIPLRSRPSDSRISSALFVQMKGVGWVFQSLIQARMSASSCWTVLW